MAVSFVANGGTAGACQVGTADITITGVANCQVDDFLILWVKHKSAGYAASDISGWTRLTDQFSTDGYLSIFYRWVTSSGTQADVSITGLYSSSVGSMAAFRGVNSTPFVNNSASVTVKKQNNAEGTYAIPITGAYWVNANWADGMAVAICAVDNDTDTAADFALTYWQASGYDDPSNTSIAWGSTTTGTDCCGRWDCLAYADWSSTNLAGVLWALTEGSAGSATNAVAMMVLSASAGNATVAAVVISRTASIPTPTVSAEAGATVTATEISRTASTPAATVSAGTGATVAATAVSRIVSTPAPTSIIAGTGAVVTATAISRVVSFPAFTISARATVTATEVSSTASTPAPTVTAEMGATVTAVEISRIVSTPAHTVAAGTGATVTATTISCTASVPTPTVTDGTGIPATVDASVVSCAATTPAPTIVAGTGATVTASVISRAATTPAATVSAQISATVTAGVISRLVDVGMPTVASGGGVTMASFRSWSYAGSGGATGTVTVGAPAGNAENDILIAHVSNDSTGAVMQTPGSGYTLLAGPHGSSQTVWVYWKRRGTSAEGNTTWTITTADELQVIISCWQNASTINNPTATQQANTSAAYTWPFPAITPAYDSSRVVALIAVDGSSGESTDFSSWTTNWTERYDYSETEYTTEREMWQAVADFAQTTAQQITGVTVTGTQTTAERSVTSMVALAPSSGGEGGPTVTITPAVLNVYTAVPVPVVPFFPAVILLPVTLPAPTVVSFDVSEVLASVIPAPATIPTPTLFAGQEAVVSASVVPVSTTVPTPTVSTSDTVIITATVISLLSSIPQAVAEAGVGSVVSPAFLSCTFVIPTPTVSTAADPYRIPNSPTGGQVTETQDFPGPICDTNGNLYYLMEGGSGDSLAYMMKSTDGGVSWAQVDSADKPTTNDYESLWLDQDPMQTGRVRMLQMDSSYDATHHVFYTSDHATTPDQWGATDQVLYSGSTAPVQCTCLVIASDGDTYGFYPITAIGGYDKFAYQRLPYGSSTWDTQVIMDSGQNYGIQQVQAVVGANDKIHIFGLTSHTSPPQVWHRSLTSGGSLSAWERVDTGGADSHSHGLTNAVYQDVGGVERVHIGWLNTSSILYTGHVDNDGTPSEDGTASGSTAIAASFLGNESSVAALQVDGNVLYALYCDASTQDLWIRQSNNLGSWSTAVELRDGISGQWLFTNVYTRGGVKRLGFVYEAGGADQYAPLLYYGEYNLTPVPTSVHATTSIPTPTVSVVAGEDATVTATVISRVVTTPAPTVFAQATVTITASVISPVVTTPMPSVVEGGGASVIVTVIQRIASTPTATVTTGARVVAGAMTRLTNMINPSIVTGTGAVLTAVNIGRVTSMPSPSTGSGSRISPVVITRAAAMAAPTLLYGAGAVPNTIPVDLDFQLPTVNAGQSVAASPTIIALLLAIPLPGITTGAVDILVRHPTTEEFVAAQIWVRHPSTQTWVNPIRGWAKDKDTGTFKQVI